jgi:hypothetical protein
VDVADSTLGSVIPAPQWSELFRGWLNPCFRWKFDLWGGVDTTNSCQGIGNRCFLVVAMQEKFSKWDDRGTGINPFVPLPPRVPSNVVVRVIRAGASWIIAAIVRAPFVALLFGLLYCVSGLATMVSTRRAQLPEGL